MIGRPALLVPLPGAIDDDQTANARALTDADAGWMMPQSTFTQAALAERLEQLFANPDLLANAAARAASIGNAGAAATLADLVEACARPESMAQGGMT